MAELTHFIWHCSDTPGKFDVQAAHILQWHLGPKDMDHGMVRYMGKTYESRDELPHEMVGGVFIRSLRGNGWSRPGYRHLISLKGFIQDLMEDYNYDNVVDIWEVTNGAVGWNSHAIHACYAGGKNNEGENFDTRNEEQLLAMEELSLKYIEKQSYLKMMGHNQVSTKECPSFFVPTWAESVSIRSENIDYKIYK